MPFQLQFNTLTSRVVIQVPNTVTEAGVHHRPYLVLKPPDSVKVNHRPNLQFQDMSGHVVSRLDKRQQRIAVAGLVDVALRLIALEGQVPCAHVPADGHRLVDGQLQTQTQIFRRCKVLLVNTSEHHFTMPKSPRLCKCCAKTVSKKGSA